MTGVAKNEFAPAWQGIDPSGPTAALSDIKFGNVVSFGARIANWAMVGGERKDQNKLRITQYGHPVYQSALNLHVAGLPCKWTY
jgi:hypothetical protein